jgi:hypothetical protein
MGLVLLPGPAAGMMSSSDLMGKAMLVPSGILDEGAG